MKVAAVAAVLATLGGPASALSCAQITPVDSFQKAAASPDDYMVLHGVLRFDTSALVANGPADPAPIAASFTGDWLTRDGFRAAGTLPVTIQQVCLASWCGSAATDAVYLIFAKQVGDDWTIALSPCPGVLFQQPDPATLAAMETCVTRSGCR